MSIPKTLTPGMVAAVTIGFLVVAVYDGYHYGGGPGAVAAVPFLLFALALSIRLRSQPDRMKSTRMWLIVAALPACYIVVNLFRN